ncbi:hypothetical protein BV372_32370 [Nostoc sp. T09]|nr:hypothetical protein BV372_32370 [Nostoc sp. T09]
MQFIINLLFGPIWAEGSYAKPQKLLVEIILFFFVRLVLRLLLNFNLLVLVKQGIQTPLKRFLL